MSNSSKFLYLPLEIVVREHDGKVTLAHEAAMQGWVVLIAPKAILYAMIDTLPQGVVMIKSATPLEHAQIKMLHESGHKICSLDEEGVVTFKEFLGDNVRFNRDNLNIIERVFFWGDEQKRIFEETFPEFAQYGVKSGSPRLEFWRDFAHEVYKDQADALRRKYGRFILIPSSFGIANNVLGAHMGLELTKKHSASNLSEDMVEFMVGQAEQNLIAFKEYIDFLPEMVASQPDINFIIRPHPSESHDIWKKMEEKLDNLHFVYEGAVTPWILASEGIYHFKSTTSIEAHLMGRPVMTYMPPMPHYLKKYTLEQPLAVSEIANSREELIEILDNVVRGKKTKEPGVIDGVLKMWVYENTECTSAESILKEMDLVAPLPTRLLAVPPLSLKRKINKKIDELVLSLNETVWAKYFPKRARNRAGSLLYGKAKASGMNFKHTRNVLDVISQLKKMKTLNMYELKEQVFVISK
ncbi:MAG: hypothetical protein CMH26_05020 [Micavibrio sp.]|nr:hypothetical protein [Micavibrio sp.]